MARFLTTAECAQVALEHDIELSESSIRAAIHAGTLPASRIAKRFVVTLRDLRAYLAALMDEDEDMEMLAAEADEEKDDEEEDDEGDENEADEGEGEDDDEGEEDDEDE